MPRIRMDQVLAVEGITGGNIPDLRWAMHVMKPHGKLHKARRRLLSLNTNTVRNEEHSRNLLNRQGRSVSLSRNRSPWLIVFFFLIGISSPSTASESIPTPSQVVFQWLEWYPKNLPMAATLTTPSLRKELSQKEWVEKNTQILKRPSIQIFRGKGPRRRRCRYECLRHRVRQVERYKLKRIFMG